ncbi:hypothetical protein G6O69_32465 [Pseudenhygromyxa sp. WMMC2535]|uniref:hypothetical protein n=1 Tax=Pseudenhygromyxa sp. WMMC2535 TaxID=2712867 RepID=UPI001555733C|nr:hypothetical protein [Pseudenhygromyxa sp. WMMC2535]NVB42583.1 hypothetical protein [Pseudenhygromyxa sp. WMMC2535]
MSDEIEIHTDEGVEIDARARVTLEPALAVHLDTGADQARGLELVVARLRLGGAQILAAWSEDKALGVRGEPEPELARALLEVSQGRPLSLHLRLPTGVEASARWLLALVTQAPAEFLPSNLPGADDLESVSTLTYARFARAPGHRNPDQIQAIENHAVTTVTAQLRTMSWRPTRVTRKPGGCELVCLRGAEAVRVEVRGTEGAGDRLLLSRGDIERASEGPCILAVLYAIETHELDGRWVAQGGQLRLIEGWDPSTQGELQVAQYRYLLPPWSDQG